MKRFTLFVASVLMCTGLFAQETVKLGIIGLDTSHSTAFTKLINGAQEGEYGVYILDENVVRFIKIDIIFENGKTKENRPR